MRACVRPCQKDKNLSSQIIFQITQLLQLQTTNPLKMADLQACELWLFSNDWNVYMAKVVNVCFVIIIQIYKETSN